MVIIPEVDNWKEIEQLLGSDLQAQRDRGIGKALQSMTLGIVNTRLAISGLHTSLGSAVDKLGDLIRTISEANTSSDKLTRALNRITLAGAVIAGLGVTTALASLFFEIYKYYHGA